MHTMCLHRAGLHTKNRLFFYVLDARGVLSSSVKQALYYLIFPKLSIVLIMKFYYINSCIMESEVMYANGLSPSSPTEHIMLRLMDYNPLSCFSSFRGVKRKKIKFHEFFCVCNFFLSPPLSLSPLSLPLFLPSLFFSLSVVHSLRLSLSLFTAPVSLFIFFLSLSLLTTE